MKKTFYNYNCVTAYVDNSAADFGETVRTTIFSVLLRGLLAREKNWSCPPAGALNFWFFFFKNKEQPNIKLQHLQS